AVGTDVDKGHAAFAHRTRFGGQDFGGTVNVELGADALDEARVLVERDVHARACAQARLAQTFDKPVDGGPVEVERIAVPVPLGFLDGHGVEVVGGSLGVETGDR